MTLGHVKSVNSHKDGAGRGRHPRDCDRFWLLMSLGHVKSVNSHRDEAGTPKNAKTPKNRENIKNVGKNLAP